jgi:hypothetical protein
LQTFIDEYLGFAAELQRSGVVLSQGCDCHMPDFSSVRYEETAKIYEHYGIKTEDFFRL